MYILSVFIGIILFIKEFVWGSENSIKNTNKKIAVLLLLKKLEKNVFGFLKIAFTMPSSLAVGGYVSTGRYFNSSPSNEFLVLDILF